MVNQSGSTPVTETQQVSKYALTTLVYAVDIRALGSMRLCAGCFCLFAAACVLMPWYDLCSQFRTSRVTTTSRGGESRGDPRAAMASNSLFSSVTPCQQNFFWGECCEKLFSFHCGSVAGHTEVERVDKRRRTRTLKVGVFGFACVRDADLFV